MEQYAHEYATHRYFSPSEIMSLGGLRLIRAGANLAKPNYRIGPRRLDYFSLHFVMDGQLNVSFDGKRVSLAKGDLFCMFPGSVYEYWIRPSERMLRMYWIAFDGPQASLLLETIGLTSSRPYGIGLAGNKLERQMNQLVDGIGNGPDADLRYIGLVYSLFGHLLASINRAAPSDSGWLDDCIRYMHLHYAEHINVNQIARHFGLNRSYVSTMLARRLGQSPGQYLQALRLKKAEQLLRETELTVTEIALSSGYPDLYSFSRAFSNAYGISPSKFRDLFDEHEAESPLT